MSTNPKYTQKEIEDMAQQFTPKAMPVEAWRIVEQSDANGAGADGIFIIKDGPDMTGQDFGGHPMLVLTGTGAWLPLAWGEWVIRDGNKITIMTHENFVEKYDIQEGENPMAHPDDHTELRHVVTVAAQTVTNVQHPVTVCTDMECAVKQHAVMWFEESLQEGDFWIWESRSGAFKVERWKV